MSGAPAPQAKEDEALVAEFLQMMIESEGAESNDRVAEADDDETIAWNSNCLLYTSPSPRDGLLSRMPSSA